ncbi:hypothetical protein EJ357_47150 [Streptomyces cyaneochromogenes]|uniref:Uncharacterized protein n=1 Tax=Streptomyces cyaneochromogenes TaxID=2496836 RepID=A0A3Q9F0S8_9ACTN|nr:hypothetical protein [Streptomyces cyaneochromogenes]AZQ40037.1 hypothetical protein EJ357_47150 [Streptomyces cyaneochromogenes]
MQREWVTGACWLGCERADLPVIYLGPVQWDGQHAPFYACEPCLDRLKAQAFAYFMDRRPAIA